MRASIEEVRAFSMCPAYYRFSKDKLRTGLNKRDLSILKIIQYTYGKVNEGKILTWNQVVGKATNTVFSRVEEANEKHFAAASQLLESILVPLSSWYKENFVLEPVGGYGNISITQELDYHVLTGTAPLIKLTDPITLVYLGSQEKAVLDVANDVFLRSIAWLVGKELNMREVRIEYLCMGNNYSRVIVPGTELLFDRTEKFLRQVLISMDRGTSYPSRTSMCKKCPYLSQCIL